MRVILACILLAACGTEPHGSLVSLAAASEGIAQNLAQAAVTIPKAAPCQDERLDRSGRPRPKPETHNQFMGSETGAWALSGGRGEGNYFFVYMQDSNAFVPGSLLVVMQNAEGRAAWLSVRAFGSSESSDEEFEGPDWEAASTSERAAIVKAALIRSAELAAAKCGGKMASLDDELATFDTAFAVFDQRHP